MEAINILLIGAGTGVIFAIISILIINTSNSERYPIGGFLPALWVIADLGESSKLVAAGLTIPPNLRPSIMQEGILRPGIVQSWTY